jgi:hypothetical protein
VRDLEVLLTDERSKEQQAGLLLAVWHPWISSGGGRGVWLLWAGKLLAASAARSTQVCGLFSLFLASRGWLSGWMPLADERSEKQQPGSAFFFAGAISEGGARKEKECPEAGRGQA